MSDPIRVLALFGARVLFGQERANIAVLEALRAEGCEVLCVIRSETWPELLAFRERLEAHGLPWVAAPHIDYPTSGWLIHTTLRNPMAFARGNLALWRILRAFSPTHIHAFNPLYVATFLGALSLTRIPFVYRAGDKPILHNIFYRSVWRFILRRTRVFVAESDFIKRALIASNVDPGRIAVINASPPGRLGAPVVDIPTTATAPGAFRFVFVGQLTPAKGLDLLIEAFRQLARVDASAHLLIAGRISEWSGDDWARELRGRAKADPDIGPRIHFPGYVEDAPALIGRCDVHVAPSIYDEPYGLVVVEAKSASRPSIIFRVGGMAELVEDGVDGVVLSEKTVGALVGALKMYAASPHLAERHGQAAHVSLRKLDLESFSRKWRQAYDQATDRHEFVGVSRQ